MLAGEVCELGKVIRQIWREEEKLRGGAKTELSVKERGTSLKGHVNLRHGEGSWTTPRCLA